MDLELLYQITVAGWGYAPSEFWGMTVSEFLFLFEIKRPTMEGDYAGGMTEGDIADIKAASKALKERLERKTRDGTSTA